MKERRCETCEWWDTETDLPGDVMPGDCHHNCESVPKMNYDWCRHWSEATGWDVCKKDPERQPYQTSEQTKIQKGLLRIASELFEKDLEFYEIKHMTAGVDMSEVTDVSVKQRWLEEYRTKC